MATQAQTVIMNSGAGFPATISGLIGWYDTQSFQEKDGKWYDKSGRGNHATTSGVVTKSSANVSGFGATKMGQCVQGTATTAYVTFPLNVILPSTYTLFHVGRKPSTDNGWILARGPSSTANTWLSGFFQAATGTAYHEGWVGTSGTDTFGRNWIISSDQNYFYRANARASTQGTAGAGAYTNQLAINWVTPSASWQFAEIIVYNRTLTSAEIGQMEGYLAQRYGITLG